MSIYNIIMSSLYGDDTIEKLPNHLLVSDLHAIWHPLQITLATLTGICAYSLEHWFDAQATAIRISPHTSALFDFFPTPRSHFRVISGTWVFLDKAVQSLAAIQSTDLLT